MFVVTDAWKAAYPGAAAGLLVMDTVENPSSHPTLDERKAALENQLLTAGHDAGVVEPRVQVDVSKDGETFVAMNGQTQALQAGDMVMRDRRGVISSVVYGPDHTSTRSPQTFAPWRRTQRS
jgi:DNA/RNA-binding domain of Phe-tRNA-synthetase-like protein